MSEEILKYLFDIIGAVESIEEYLGIERDFTKYKSNKMLKRAVEREFEILGEAMSRLNKINPDINISEKSRIIGMRNRVIHGYDTIDDEIIWGTIVRHLPNLKKEVLELMKQ